MKKSHVSRRQLLAGLGAGGLGLALPMLPSLISRAKAAEGRPPKRFIAIAHYVGHHIPHFFPSATADVKVSDHTFYRKLSDIPGDLSVVLNAKFDPYRATMNVFQGLDSIGGGGHNQTVPLCGGAPVSDADQTPKFGRSIDVLMSRSPRVYDTVTRFPSVRIANDYGGTNGMSFDRTASGKGVQLASLSGDVNVFNALFDGANLDPAGKAAAEKHRLLVDRSFERYRTLQKDSRLSATDRTRFEAHVTAMSDLQKRLQVAASCSKPTYDAYGEGKPRELMWRNKIDALVAAMACDMTRVASVYIHDFKFGTAPQNYQDSHGNSHDREAGGAQAAASAEYSAFKADQVLHLLERLSNTTEADGSRMLDNTVVLWTSELANGNFHTATDLPAVTFGSAGGSLKTGYLMDFRLKPLQYVAGRTDFFTPIGQSYNRLLVTLMRAMGMNEAEYVNEGDGGGFGQFSQTVEYIDKQYTQFIAQRNTPLPVVFA